MKLSTTLLSAILVGITVQGMTSCSKDKEISNKNEKTTNAAEVKNPPYEPCLACGMG